MKKIVIFLSICFFTQISIAQIDTTNITTSVITLDLSKPHYKSVRHSNKKNKLVVKNRNLLAFKLINGNPFRFRYELNFKKVNLFTNETFNPTIDDSNTDNVLADEDGDGIPDPLDEEVNIANPMTKEIITILQDDLKMLQDKLKKSLSGLKQDIDNYISDISDDYELNTDLLEFNKTAYKEAYIEYLNEIYLIQDKISLLPADDSEIIQNQSELYSIAESVRRQIEKLLSARGGMFLLPIDINGDNIDYIEVWLDIYDGDNQKPETYKYKVWIKGGLKIDVSGGVHITSLFDNKYYTRDAEDNEKFIFEDDNGKYDFGFGTMVNISLRGGSWFRPTLNFGALFTSNQKFQMLTGIGFILGKNERLILHGGLSMGRVNVLRDNFLTDGETSYDLGADGTVPVNEKFKFGHFFGITYNIGKPKSNKDKEQE